MIDHLLSWVNKENGFKYWFSSWCLLPDTDVLVIQCFQVLDMYVFDWFVVCIMWAYLWKLELQKKSPEVVKSRKITIKIRDKKETMGASFESGTLEDDQELESEQLNLRCHREWDDRSSVPPLPKEVHCFLTSPTVLSMDNFLNKAVGVCMVVNLVLDL